MTEPEYQPSSRRGCFVLLVFAALIVAGVVAVVKLWPDSTEERQAAAVDACKDAVDQVAPTEWRKLWQASAFDVSGEDHMTVTGKFATKDSGFREFTCRVENGKVVDAAVRP